MSSPYTMWLPVCRWMLVSREPRRSPTLIPWTTPRTAPSGGCGVPLNDSKHRFWWLALEVSRTATLSVFFFSKMLEKTTHLMVYQCLSACFSHWKAAIFWMYTDCMPGISPFSDPSKWVFAEFSGIRPSTSSAELANMQWRRVLRCHKNSPM